MILATASSTFQKAEEQPHRFASSFLSWKAAAERIPGVLFFVVGLSCLANFLFYFRFQGIFRPDSVTYIVPAANLLAGRGFLNDLGQPEIYRTPGYSFFILPFLATKVDLTQLVVLQHLIAVAIAFGTSLFVFRLSRNCIHALVAGVVISLDFPTLATANTILSEIPFTAVVLLALYFLWSVEIGATR